ncbi:hypothetical protein DRQ17_04870 [bacterium]|nr:MAG: hypothetical protein DRQ17_04870 [bacterium]
MLLALGIAASVALWNIENLRTQKIELEINNLLVKLTNKINTAFLEGHGFSTKIILPDEILGFNYSINITSNDVLLKLSGITYGKKIITRNVTGLPKAGTNIIRNENNIIIIENE